MTEEVVFQTVLRALPARPVSAEVTRETTLESLGISSMELLNVIFRIESELDINLLAEDVEVDHFRTVGDTVRIAWSLAERAA